MIVSLTGPSHVEFDVEADGPGDGFRLVVEMGIVERMSVQQISKNQRDAEGGRGSDWKRGCWDCFRDFHADRRFLDCAAIPPLRNGKGRRCSGRDDKTEKGATLLAAAGRHKARGEKSRGASVPSASPWADGMTNIEQEKSRELFA